MSEPEGKRYVTTHAKKQRSAFDLDAKRTKMKKKAREEIILFLAVRHDFEHCHKKAYDHAPEGARTSGVAFRGGRIAVAFRPRRILLSADA
jgi:hypothetical protein